MRGLDAAISQALQTPVNVAANPLWCVALGTGVALERWKK
jgi:actin-like ATPase involved in cell morphogenesis